MSPTSPSILQSQLLLILFSRMGIIHGREMSITVSRPFTISTYDPPSTAELFLGQGQAVGGKSRSRQSASQDVNSRSCGNPDKTPS